MEWAWTKTRTGADPDHERGLVHRLRRDIAGRPPNGLVMNDKIGPGEKIRRRPTKIDVLWSRRPIVDGHDVIGPTWLKHFDFGHVNQEQTSV
jgi:hypothetical protein